MKLVWILLVPSLSIAACVPIASTPGVTRIDAVGTWRHGPSGLSFPDRLGDFQRIDINQYERPGTAASVGVGYNSKSAASAIAFTVYVGPPITLEDGRPATLQVQFEMEKDVIRQHEAASEVWSRPVSLAHDRAPLSGYAAEFRYTESFAQERQPVISQLFLFESNGWFIKYRVTFAAIQESTARSIVDAFLQSAPWGSAAQLGAAAIEGPAGPAVVLR